MRAVNTNKVNLLLRADDAGSCISANDAIMEVCASGMVKNVSVMACGPAFDDAVARLRHRPDLCLGLHITLNAEWAGPKWGPVLDPKQVPCLVDANTGFFTPFPHDLQARGLSVDEAIAEVTAQLAKMRDAGLNIAYLDEHMGVGWLPGLRDALADFARREGLIDAIPLPVSYLNLPDVAPDATVEQIAAHFQEAVTSAAPGNYFFVTHPGKIAPDMEAFALAGEPRGVVARERDRERELLLRLATQTWESERVAFISYADMARV